MNTERLEYLADWLEAGAPHQGKVLGFDIAVGVQYSFEQPHCGTTCCIAGAATQFFNDEDGALFNDAYQAASVRYSHGVGEAEWKNVFKEAQELLGLSFVQAQQLFVPVGATRGFVDDGDAIYGSGERDWADFNDPYKAARVIRNLIATGTVDWDIE